jgi:L-lactate dehydrogenase
MSGRTEPTLAILGAGPLGAAVARECLARGLSQRIRLHDADGKAAAALALDLRGAGGADVEGGNDPAVCAGADTAVLAMGADVAALRRWIPLLVKSSPDAVLLMLSRPVEALTYAALRLCGLPRSRVIGIGTVLETQLFRRLIARRCKVAVSDVMAYVAGAQGDAAIPLWSSASIGGILLNTWAVPGHGRLTVRDRAEIFTAIKATCRQAFEGSWAVAGAAATVLAAVLGDANEVWPVSALFTNMGEVSNVCLSVPSILNRNGVEDPLAVPMNAAEKAGLASCAAAVKDSIRALGFE